MILFNKNGYYYSTLINDSNYFSCFSTRVLGDGRDRQNILNFLTEEKLNANNLFIPSQNHTDTIRFLPEDENHLKDCDGVITSEKQITIGVVTADCVPIIFVDKTAGIIGVSHQGWKGTLNRLAPKMIAAMISRGAKKEDIVAAIGPSIGDCCYRLYGERLEEFNNEFPELAKKAVIEREGETKISLVYLNYLLLREEGIDSQNIDSFPFCTRCNEIHFYSYQRNWVIEGDMFHVILKK